MKKKPYSSKEATFRVEKEKGWGGQSLQEQYQAPLPPIYINVFGFVWPLIVLALVYGYWRGHWGEETVLLAALILFIKTTWKVRIR